MKFVVVEVVVEVVGGVVVLMEREVASCFSMPSGGAKWGTLKS